MARPLGDAHMRIGDVKSILLNIIQALARIHTHRSLPPRLKLMVLKVFEGPNRAGRLHRVTSPVTPEYMYYIHHSVLQLPLPASGIARNVMLSGASLRSPAGIFTPLRPGSCLSSKLTSFSGVPFNSTVEDPKPAGDASVNRSAGFGILTECATA